MHREIYVHPLGEQIAKVACTSLESSSVSLTPPRHLVKKKKGTKLTLYFALLPVTSIPLLTTK